MGAPKVDPTSSTDPRADLSSLCLAITEHALVAMATVQGPRHVVCYANPAFCRLMGRPGEELVGKPLGDMLPEKDACLALLDTVHRTGKPESHTDRLNSEPHSVLGSLTIWPVMSEEGTVGVMVQVTETARNHDDILEMNEALILGSLRQHELTEAAEASNAQLQDEISDRERAQAALRASEERYRALFGSLPVAVFACDRSGVVQSYNHRAAELWGREPVVGDPAERYWGSPKLFLLDGTLVPISESPMVDVLRTGVSTKNVELITERPDGSRIPVVISYATLKDEEGEVTGAIGSFDDISERIEAEEVLRDAAERKNEFLAMLAHELRNPLAPISFALEIAKRAEGNDDLMRPALATMERQLGQMTRLVEDLLDVGRISQGKLDLRREKVELASVIQPLVEVSRRTCDAAGQELTVALPPDAIHLDADPVRLAQVFGNLLDNACKFTGPAGRVSLTAERQGEDAVVTVRDSGIGMTPELLPTIFEVFTQGDQSLARSRGGLGIGLTLVKRLVELHGGTVRATSGGHGRGSEFVVRLPALLEEQELARPPVAPAEEEASPSLGRRVLVVDDNHDTATSLAMLLSMAGHETRTAFDGLEAVTVAAAFKPEVVLLDIGMPKLNGFDAARLIRAEPWGKDMVLYALTGWGQDEDREKTLNAGFDGHLVKPVEYDTLTSLLANLPLKS